MKSKLPRVLTFFLICTTVTACSPRLRAQYNELRRAEQERLVQEWAEAQKSLEESNRQFQPQVLKQEEVVYPAAKPELRPDIDKNNNNILSERVLRDRSRAAASSEEHDDLPMRHVMSRRDQLKSRTLSRQDALSGILSPEVEAKLASGDFDPETFNPTPFKEGSPEWHVAMINFILRMKGLGHEVKETQLDVGNVKTLSETYEKLQEMTGNKKQPIVCKSAPYNICYKMDKNGELHPIGNRRPVRILRVY